MSTLDGIELLINELDAAFGKAQAEAEANDPRRYYDDSAQAYANGLYAACQIACDFERKMRGDA